MCIGLWFVGRESGSRDTKDREIMGGGTERKEKRYNYPFKSLHAVVQHSRNLMFRTQSIIDTHKHTRDMLCNISTPHIFGIKTAPAISTPVVIHSQVKLAVLRRIRRRVDTNRNSVCRSITSLDRGIRRGSLTVELGDQIVELLFDAGCITDGNGTGAQSFFDLRVSRLNT